MDNAYVLIGLSVLMHVAWNLLARYVDRRANYLWWGILAHLVLLGPYAIWHLIRDAHWSAPLWVALIVTAVANSTYFITLRRAYHCAPVALVYPLARSSPLLIAVWSVLLFDEQLSWQAAAAIGISIVGLWVLASASGSGDGRHALPWALVAALATSVYSLSDKVAVIYLPSFAAQLGFITVGYFASWIGLTLVQKHESGRWLPEQRPRLSYLLVGGLFIGTAYALVVRAMLHLPVAHVVTFTNAGIVLAVLLSILAFRETEHSTRRLAGAGVVSFGLILLGMGA